jgi:VanZ family protein
MDCLVRSFLAGDELALRSSDHIEYSSRRLLGISTFSILLLTLFPYHFRNPNASFGPVWNARGTYTDFFLNILLFIPFGAGIAVWVEAKPRTRMPGWAAVLLGSALLSASVEFAQRYLPFRDPCLNDLLANIVGGMAGFACFAVGRGRILRGLFAWERLIATTRFRQPGAAFLIYLSTAVLVSAVVQHSINLKQWDTSYPLLLGNERTGNRPWSGKILSLQVGDRAITRKKALELSRSMQCNLQDPVFRFRPGAPDMAGFSWKGLGSRPAAESALRISGSLWLESSSAGALITRRLQKSNQFTVLLQCTAAGIAQTGPARIVSISKDPYFRNFTIAQNAGSLVVRLRTQATGANGISPELNAPSVFKPGIVHTIVVTYDGARLLAFVDGEAQKDSLDLGPASRLFFSKPSLMDSDLKGFQTLYYCLVFLPLGFFLSESCRRSRLSQGWKLIVSISGALLASGAMELALTAVSGKFFSWENFGWGFMLISFAPLFHFQIPYHGALCRDLR